MGFYGLASLQRSRVQKLKHGGGFKKWKQTHGRLHELEENEHPDSNRCIQDHHEGMMEE